MARGKNIVLVYKDWEEKFESLEDDEAGRLIKHFFRYINDRNPTPPDRITKLMFIDIENTLKRDLKKWDEGSEVRREKARKAGLASANSRKLKSTQINSQVKNTTQSTVTDRVRVNDTVNVSVNEIVREEKTKKGNNDVDEILTSPSSSNVTSIILNKKNESLSPPREITEMEIAWNDWLYYKKKQFRFTYKASKFEEIAKKSLWKLSGENESTAIEIINQSIANGWKGFQPLKNQPIKNKYIEQNGFESLINFTS